MSEEQMTSMAGENLLEVAAPTQPDAPALQGQEVRRWWTGLGGTQATSLVLGVCGWIIVLGIAFGSLRVSIREHTTEEGYLESYGFGYAIVFGLIVLFLNGLLGILLALIGMVTTKKPRVELLCNPRAREPVASFRSVCLTGSVVWGLVSPHRAHRWSPCWAGCRCVSRSSATACRHLGL